MVLNTPTETFVNISKRVGLGSVVEVYLVHHINHLTEQSTVLHVLVNLLKYLLNDSLSPRSIG